MYVFPSAAHTRFEHSLGVAHLAGKLTRQLQAQQPPGEVTDLDVLCVKVAGLCHDLGHGPYSHLWQTFIERHKPALRWTHEQASVQMLDYLIRDNAITIQDYGLTQRDIQFIGELIVGVKPDQVCSEWSLLRYH